MRSQVVQGLRNRLGGHGLVGLRPPQTESVDGGASRSNVEQEQKVIKKKRLCRLEGVDLSAAAGILADAQREKTSAVGRQARCC